MVPPASIARTSCSVITQSNRVSSNKSLCCRETKFCRQRQWRRNGSGRPRRPLQRRDPRQQSRQFGVTCPELGKSPFARKGSPTTHSPPKRDFLVLGD